MTPAEHVGYVAFLFFVAFAGAWATASEREHGLRGYKRPRLAALESAPRLALRYVARAVAWAHGDPTTRPITYGAFVTDGEAWEAHRVLSKDPPSGFNGVDQCSVEPEIVVIVGDVVQVVTLGEVIAGGSK